MAFKPGQSGNPAGKPIGAKNKVPNELREDIIEFLSSEFGNLKKTYKTLKPADQVKIYTDLLQYGLPKMRAMSVDIDWDNLTDEQLTEIITRLKNSA